MSASRVAESSASSLLARTVVVGVMTMSEQHQRDAGGRGDETEGDRSGGPDRDAEHGDEHDDDEHRPGATRGDHGEEAPARSRRVRRWVRRRVVHGRRESDYFTVKVVYMPSAKWTCPAPPAPPIIVLGVFPIMGPPPPIGRLPPPIIVDPVPPIWSTMLQKAMY